jgi:hypothetical protein
MSTLSDIQTHFTPVMKDVDSMNQLYAAFQERCAKYRSSLKAPLLEEIASKINEIKSQYDVVLASLNKLIFHVERSKTPKIPSTEAVENSMHRFFLCKTKSQFQTILKENQLEMNFICGIVGDSYNLMVGISEIDGVAQAFDPDDIQSGINLISVTKWKHVLYERPHFKNGDQVLSLYQDDESEPTTVFYPAIIRELPQPDTPKPFTYKLDFGGTVLSIPELWIVEHFE